MWALSSAVERSPHTGEVVGSNPTAPTISLINFSSASNPCRFQSYPSAGSGPPLRFGSAHHNSSLLFSTGSAPGPARSEAEGLLPLSSFLGGADIPACPEPRSRTFGIRGRRVCLPGYIQKAPASPSGFDPRPPWPLLPPSILTESRRPSNLFTIALGGGLLENFPAMLTPVRFLLVLALLFLTVRRGR